MYRFSINRPRLQPRILRPILIVQIPVSYFPPKTVLFKTLFFPLKRLFIHHLPAALVLFLIKMNILAAPIRQLSFNRKVTAMFYSGMLPVFNLDSQNSRLVFRKIISEWLGNPVQRLPKYLINIISIILIFINIRKQVNIKIISDIALQIPRNHIA